MKIKTVFKYLSPAVYQNYGELEFSSLCIDSRIVQKNDLFIAQKGHTTDSHCFIEAIIRKGAFVLHNQDIPIPSTLNDEEKSRIFFVENTSDILAPISKAYFSDPDDSLIIIGITGTNGKTSTSYMLKAIFEQERKKVGIIGTISHLIGDIEIQAKNTTPDGFELYGLLAQMKEHKCDVVVLEISSHALALKRCDLLQLNVALFTNLSQDHLDFHPTLQDYFESKLTLFNLLKESHKTKKMAFFNGTLPESSIIKDSIENLSLPYQSFGLKYKETSSLSLSISGRIDHLSTKETQATITLPNHKEFLLTLRMQGEFNIENALGAIGVSYFYDAQLKSIIEGLHDIKVKGRFENITPHLDFSVIIDFAHTPDALKNVLKTARNLNPHKIITVFGAGGNRDPLKRPKMALAVNLYSDIAIITSDNPRKENPYHILDDVERGFLENNSPIPYYKIVNRTMAIKKALTLAENNDIIIVAGKGHETYQIFKNKTIHFSDHEVVEKLLLNK